MKMTRLYFFGCPFSGSLILQLCLFFSCLVAGGHTLSGPHWSMWVVACTAFVLMYFSMYSNIAFMMVGILDLRRRHYVATKLDELLRTGVYTGSLHVRNTAFPRSLRSRSLMWLKSINSHSPSRGTSTSGSDRRSLTAQGIVIDFHDVESLQAWWITRVLVHNFGLGFFKRIKVSDLLSIHAVLPYLTLIFLLQWEKHRSSSVDRTSHQFAWIIPEMFGIFWRGDGWS